MNFDPRRAERWPYFLALFLPLTLLAYLGQDANWDLRNYHLYDPHAWLSGRWIVDVAPARLQSWFNPLLDAPLYLMVRAGLPGLATGVWLTLPIMASLWSLLFLHRKLSNVGTHRIESAALLVLAGTGAATLPAIGASFNDGFVAAGMLGALVLLMRTHPASTRDWALAGVIAGVTAGLKLTGGVYCLGLAAAACVAVPGSDWRARLRLLSALACGGTIGFALGYGFWGWALWQRFGNPFFPFFNQVFHSPYALPTDFVHPKFRPHDLLDGLSTPLHLSFLSNRFSELPLRDPRLLLGAIASVALWIGERRRRDSDFRQRMLLAFYLVSLAAWIWMYGIYRYTVAIEMLAGLLVVLALRTLPKNAARIALVLTTLAVVAATVHPHWERRPFSSPMLTMAFPTLPPRSLIVTSGEEPVGFAALKIRNDTPIISIYSNVSDPEHCTALQVRAEGIVARHDGPLWLLRTTSPSDDPGQRIAARYYGLKVVGACQDIESSLDRLRLCRLVREARPRNCDSQNTTRSD